MTPLVSCALSIDQDSRGTLRMLGSHAVCPLNVFQDSCCLHCSCLLLWVAFCVRHFLI